MEQPTCCEYTNIACKYTGYLKWTLYVFAGVSIFIAMLQQLVCTYILLEVRIHLWQSGTYCILVVIKIQTLYMENSLPLKLCEFSLQTQIVIERNVGLKPLAKVKLLRKLFVQMKTT